jgi:hypothetical protein
MKAEAPLKRNNFLSRRSFRHSISSLYRNGRRTYFRHRLTQPRSMKLFPTLLLTAGALLAAALPAAQAQSANTGAVRVNANVASVAAPVVAGPPREYVILTGSSSLSEWEKYKAVPHDQFWGSFVRASRTRVQQIEAQIGNDPNAMITWLVFEDGYKARAAQDHQDLIGDINSVRDKYHLHLVPVETGVDVINYLNNGQPRDRVKVVDFEYFGHSNRCCFMFDYSNNIDSASKFYLHEDQLGALHRNDFARNAFVKSWGCHTGESMSKKFYDATGTHMIGAIGRTDYSNRDEALNGVIPVLSSADGKWVQ